MITIERASFFTAATSPHRVEHESFSGQAVAIIIFNAKGEILLIQQAHDKEEYARRAGQWNIITETREDNEHLKSTVARAFQEELGIPPAAFQPVPKSYKEIIEEYTSGSKYTFGCMCFVYPGNPTTPPDTLFQSHDGEISGYRWTAVEELEAIDLEQGARMVIDFYRNEPHTKQYFL